MKKNLKTMRQYLMDNDTCTGIFNGEAARWSLTLKKPLKVTHWKVKE